MLRVYKLYQFRQDMSVCLKYVQIYNKRLHFYEEWMDIRLFYFGLVPDFIPIKPEPPGTAIQFCFST